MSAPQEEIAGQWMAEILKERKADRRGRMIRLVIVGFIIFGILGFFKDMTSGKSDKASSHLSKDYVSLVRLNGEIGPGQQASAEQFVPSLVRAFEDNSSKGVVIVVNSPGGTPVQASLIHDRIVSLKKEYPSKKVVVVGEDMVTSGAYMVAVAADKIYVNRSTIAGSIGVISRNFGFTGIMDKLGVERRTLTSGTSKNRMDPFGPMTNEDRSKMEEVLSKIHAHFIDTVKTSRQGKLHEKETNLFSGDFWTGEEAVKLGLADGLSDLSSVLQAEFQVKQFRDYSPQRSIFESLSKGVLGEAKAMVDQTPLVQATITP